MFTEKELQELKKFDEEIDKEERLRKSESDWKSKHASPEIRERIRQANREYYQKNRERIRARRKARWHDYEKDPPPEIREKMRQAKQEYYQKNRERIRAKRKAKWHDYEKHLVQQRKKGV